ncbi:MAG: NAD-dependent malic enzyme [Gammaproteobacteria bacterium]
MMQHKRPLYIRYAGPVLLETPLLNKGSAFTEEERQNFNLEGLLPQNIETIEEQSQRCYQQFCRIQGDLEKHIYLRNIQDTNETLLYRLVIDHLDEMMPIIYTPTVGRACQEFSRIYRRNRGLFVSYPDRDRIDDILQNATKRNVKVIVVTDGERILGLGDQGIGGMGIPNGKLSLYTACGGISPAYTLPVVLDVGTNNSNLIDDPMYMGWRHARITGSEYYEFVEQFVQAVLRRWPNVLLQFEDFAAQNANPLLEIYRDKLCCFNDDIQGTAAVTVGTLLAACRYLGVRLEEQRIVFLGAGSAGCGIAEQIVAKICASGVSEAEARRNIYLLNSKGLVLDNNADLRDYQRKLAQKVEYHNWLPADGVPQLLDVVRHVKPTILVGVSGQAAMFDRDIVETMAEHCSRPVIMPLSNPTSKAEGIPSEIIAWSGGKALVATGSPFDPVVYQGETFPISQCNNSYIFPGVGLGIIASGAVRVTDAMLMAASEALAQCSPLAAGIGDALLPPVSTIREVSKLIAKAVAIQAMEDGVAVTIAESVLDERISKNFWEPQYRHYRRTSF